MGRNTGIFAPESNPLEWTDPAFPQYATLTTKRAGRKKCRGAGVLKILLSWKTLCAVTAIMT